MRAARVVPRRVGSAHLLSFIAIVLAVAAPAGAALVTATGIANNAIESRHIKNGKVTAADLAAKSVTSRQVAVGAIKATHIAKDSIGASQVTDGSLTGADLVDGSVSALDLAPGTVSASALASGSIGASLLTDGGISTADLADGVVTSSKLAAGAVTGSKLGDLSVTSGKLADGAVTSSKFATGAVDETAIGAGAVDSVELADGAVLTQHLATGSVTGTRLGTVVGVSLSRSAAISIPADPDVAPTLDETNGTVVPFALEEFDTASMWALGTPGSVVLPSSGVYQITGWIDWSADNDGWRELQVVVDAGVAAQDRRSTFNGSLGNRSNMTISTVVSALAGEVVQLRVSQAAGNALDLNRARLSVVRIGSA